MLVMAMIDEARRSSIDGEACGRGARPILLAAGHRPHPLDPQGPPYLSEPCSYPFSLSSDELSSEPSLADTLKSRYLCHQTPLLKYRSLMVH